MTKQELTLEMDRHLSGYDVWSDRFPLLSAEDERHQLLKHEQLYYDLVCGCAEQHRAWFTRQYSTIDLTGDNWLDVLWERRPNGSDIIKCLKNSSDRRLNRLSTEWLDVREYLIASNIRLVFKVAHRHTDRGLALLDLAQEGQFGLIRALERFRCDKELRFSTYATHWITQYIRLAIKKQTRVVAVPTNVQDEIARTNRELARAQQAEGRRVGVTELARRSDLTTHMTQQLLSLNTPVQSLDDPLSADSEFSGLDMLSAGFGQPEQLQLQHDDQETVRRLIEQLTEREQLILAMRYGIGMSTEYGYREIAEQLNLSRERVRQLEKQALMYLRDRVRHMH